MKPLYGLHEISDLKRFGDERIFDFFELCRQIVGSNSIELTSKQLAVILVEKMAPSKVLAQDVAYWRRLEEGNDQKTYEYLVNAMQRYFDRDQMEKNNSGRRAPESPRRQHRERGWRRRREGPLLVLPA